jgi:dGTP triphosphohydrolase
LTDLYASFDPAESVRDIDFSGDVRAQLSDLRLFLAERLYAYPRVAAATAKGRRIVTALCEHYRRSPTDKILALQKRNAGTLEEAVKDYVAGMTDGFARLQSAHIAQESTPARKAA